MAEATAARAAGGAGAWGPVDPVGGAVASTLGCAAGRTAGGSGGGSGGGSAGGGPSVGEAPEAALVEEERVAFAGRAHGLDLADDDEVVPARVHGVDPAVDPRGDRVELR